MTPRVLEELMGRAEDADGSGRGRQTALGDREQVSSSGPISDALQGTWLEHPLHPVVTANAATLGGYFGAVVTGPPTSPQPAYEARIDDGKLAVRLRR